MILYLYRKNNWGILDLITGDKGVSYAYWSLFIMVIVSDDLPNPDVLHINLHIRNLHIRKILVGVTDE